MSIKQDRMSDRIHTIISQLLMREISDPRLQNITVTEVSLDPELTVARIYVNALGVESRQEEVMAGLDRASGFIRRELGKRIRLRSTPSLRFYWDTTLEQGEYLNRLIDTLDIPADEENADNEEGDRDDS